MIPSQEGQIANSLAGLALDILNGPALDFICAVLFFVLEFLRSVGSDSQRVSS